jgi:hypothetical protein
VIPIWYEPNTLAAMPANSATTASALVTRSRIDGVVTGRT